MARFETLWRNKWLTSEAKSIDEMADTLEEAAERLREMSAKGVKLDVEMGGVCDDYAFLVTEDPEVAKEFGLEEPFWDDEEDDEWELAEDDNEEEE